MALTYIFACSEGRNRRISIALTKREVVDVNSCQGLVVAFFDQCDPPLELGRQLDVCRADDKHANVLTLASRVQCRERLHDVVKRRRAVIRMAEHGGCVGNRDALPELS